MKQPGWPRGLQIFIFRSETLVSGETSAVSEFFSFRFCVFFSTLPHLATSWGLGFPFGWASATQT